VDRIPGFFVVVVSIKCLREELVDGRGRHESSVALEIGA
jgi:hypothetical protein